MTRSCWFLRAFISLLSCSTQVSWVPKYLVQLTVEIKGDEQVAAAAYFSKSSSLIFYLRTLLNWNSSKKSSLRPSLMVLKLKWGSVKIRRRPEAKATIYVRLKEVKFLGKNDLSTRKNRKLKPKHEWHCFGAHLGVNVLFFYFMIQEIRDSLNKKLCL